MIIDKVYDVFTFPGLTHIVHQANLFHTFGAGIAAEIKKRYPAAFDADCKTVKGSKAKLGYYSFAAGKPTIVNLYSQVGIGGKDRNTSYDAMNRGLSRLEAHLKSDTKNQPCTVGIPYGIGCGLASGSWPVVRAILEDVFAKSSVRVVICTHPDLLTSPSKILTGVDPNFIGIPKSG